MSRKDRNVKTVLEFELAHGRQPFDLHEVYKWAVPNGKWTAPIDLAEKKFIQELGQALREEYFTAEDGSRVRKYHAIMRTKDGKQQSLWANMWDAPLEHLEEAFQQRRKQSLGDCRQLKTDIEYCNKKRFVDEPIQMSFNFDEDLAEEEALRQMEMEQKKAA
jgi:hypothetical protein